MLEILSVLRYNKALFTDLLLYLLVGRSQTINAYLCRAAVGKWKWK